jgi:hypothetical protein
MGKISDREKTDIAAHRMRTEPFRSFGWKLETVKPLKPQTQELHNVRTETTIQNDLQFD